MYCVKGLKSWQLRFLITQEFASKHAKIRKNWEVGAEFPSQAVIEAFLTPLVESSEEPFEWGVCVCVYMYMCVCVCVCVCLCFWIEAFLTLFADSSEEPFEWGECVCICVCVSARVCVCVCVCFFPVLIAVCHSAGWIFRGALLSLRVSQTRRVVLISRIYATHRRLFNRRVHSHVCHELNESSKDHKRVSHTDACSIADFTHIHYTNSMSHRDITNLRLTQASHPNITDVCHTHAPAPLQNSFTCVSRTRVVV